MEKWGVSWSYQTQDLNNHFQSESTQNKWAITEKENERILVLPFFSDLSSYPMHWENTLRACLNRRQWRGKMGGKWKDEVFVVWIGNWEMKEIDEWISFHFVQN